jgi:hypothetical protein
MTELPWLEGASLCASGSHALAALVRWGVGGNGWRRVWLPSYYCPDVPAALMTAVGREVDLRAYSDATLWMSADLSSVEIAPGDVVVIANQLGVRAAPDTTALAAAGAVIVEDHSHDLASSWALESTADYAFASLRKTLPIPDGGAVWSPSGRELPLEPDDDAQSAASGVAAERLAAALADRAGRTFATDDRLRFRALSRATAAPAGAAARHAISPVSRALLPQMPVRAWRERRRRNLAVVGEAASSASGVRVLIAPDGGVAFALTLVFDTVAQRRTAQTRLAARAVVPTVLWPLDATRDWGVTEGDADLSSRILSIHGDQRYDDADMQRLAVILREALDG